MRDRVLTALLAWTVPHWSNMASSTVASNEVLTHLSITRAVSTGLVLAGAAYVVGPRRYCDSYYPG